MKDLLIKFGYDVTNAGSEHQCIINCEKITLRENLWYNHYQQKGGDIIDFLTEYHNLDFKSAIFLLLENDSLSPIQATTKGKEFINFSLPIKNKDNNRIVKYLNTKRNISKPLISYFINKGLIYESKEHHNIVFVGYDKQKTARHAHLRGITSSPFKSNIYGSNPNNSFNHITNSDTLHFFESPIDALSYIELFKIDYSNFCFACACGVSSKVLFMCLDKYRHIKNVVICLDNDKAGKIASDRISKELTSENINNKILTPKYKDWNEDLIKHI